eukprot:3189362-Alexandrium_andersonii.AAC.1
MGPSGNPSHPPLAEAGFTGGPPPPPSAGAVGLAWQLAYTFARSAIAGCNSVPGNARPLPG